jgi:hypothetical protein
MGEESGGVAPIFLQVVERPIISDTALACALGGPVR